MIPGWVLLTQDGILAALAALAAGLIRCGCLTITARRPPRGKQAGCPLAPKGGGQ